MGECGEYELLFTIRKKDEEEFLNQTSARKVQVNRIGEITGDSRKVLFEGKEKIRFDNFDISARDFEDVRDYLNELTKYLSP